MCWTSESFNPKVATKDIIVYKLVFVHKHNIKSIYYGYLYILDKVNPYESFTANKVGEWYSVSLGYHSYISKPFKHDGYAFNIYWYFINKLTELNLSDNNSIKILECKIPKGTRYVINKEGYVVSSTIIAKRILELKEEKDVFELWPSNN